HSCSLQTCNRKLAHLVLQLVGFRLVLYKCNGKKRI
ncbi:hypothetical protein NT06LI_1283a, partial [Listeria innocua FSL J1-023]